MAKIKKKLAEKILNKKTNSNKKILNPFEIHINKQKHQILGQKLKNDRGLPGVSRAKALKKRKRTLLPEYNVQHKNNKFLDRRIGEKNNMMTEEDRQMARFTAERIKHHNKKSIFNLADDEVLTHRGQTLNEIEKFDDPRSSDDDDDDLNNDRRKSSGKLDDTFVGDAHFGGGVLTKTGKEGSRTHKELIEQLIAESKKRKAEKQKTKEQTLELTEKLDSEWKDLLPLVNQNTKSNDDPSEKHQKPDDYDKVMRELRFEARGNPSDRLKSEDEIAREEKERLEKLEQERIDRMNGFVSKPANQSKHRSADDLDDNFDVDLDNDFTLAYDETGKLINGSEDVNENGNEENVTENAEESDANEENSEEDDESEEETDDDLSDLKQSESDSDLEEAKENTTSTQKKDIKITKNRESETTKLSENNVETKKRKVNDSTNDSKVEKPKKVCKTDSVDKLQNIVDKVDNKDKIKKEIVPLLIQKRILENAKEKIDKVDNENEIEQEIDPIVQKEIMEKARKELPYTYKLPESYEDLETLLKSQPPEYQNVIVERMIKCNHPSLGAENKNNLSRLFIYLLQHLNDVAQEYTEETTNDCENIKLCFSVLNSLTPHIYQLSQMDSENARHSIMEVLKEKHEEYRKKPKAYPSLDIIVFLKLISCLFSTSDFRHPVVTPALVFIGQMLTNCKVKTKYDITYGLFLITLFIEYTTLSKRYMPAAVIYLMGIFHMAIPKLGVKLEKIYPPFKANSSILVLVEKHNKDILDLKMNCQDFEDNEINEEFKFKIIYLTLKLTAELYENWNNLSSSTEIFEPLLILLEKIPVVNYPSDIQKEMEKVKNILLDHKNLKKREYIMYEKKKPKALRLYEPNIQKVYDGKKYRPMSAKKAEREKLLHKYKKEMKGAIREIRRDKSFLGRVKIKQQIQSDIERKEKVKRIFADASIQQSELNELDRKKKRK